jgi:hypothetical protein
VKLQLTQLKSRKIISGLKRKQFDIIKEKQDHIWIGLKIDDEFNLKIRTKISHGSHGKVISIGLLKTMTKDVGLDDVNQFINLVNCPLSYEDFIEYLRTHDKV